MQVQVVTDPDGFHIQTCLDHKCSDAAFGVAIELVCRQCSEQDVIELAIKHAQFLKLCSLHMHLLQCLLCCCCCLCSLRLSMLNFR